MAPSQKRKPAQDDFILTIDDDDELPFEEEEVTAEPPKKKAKTDKKSKKSKRDASPEDDEEEDGVEGIWGFNDDDDGAMDSEFEFGAEEGNNLGTEEFEEWGFDGAKKGMRVEKAGVDLDEIIRRRREKKLGKAAADEVPEAEVEAEEDEAMDVDLDDDDDEVLADDAFGMNVASDVEESGDEKDEEDDNDENESGAEDLDEDDDAASDNDSVATPTGHPEDDVSDASDEEDAEEEAKRKAFFAPEEKEEPGKKTIASSFQAMSLSRPILRGLASVGFTKPTPIQSKSIPIALMGRDLVGGAVTGSGKTGAFIVPILERLLYRPKKIPTTRVVVLTPTRELAMQCHAVATKLAAFTDIKFTLAVGGLSLKAQELELKLRPDVIIATPGRFIDHMRNSASFNVDTIEIMVLDEADRMLEDGFAEELNEILTTLPKSRQTMLFSATMTSTVDRLIQIGLNKPARVMVDSQKKTVTTLVQEFVRLRPGRDDKRMGYLAHVCKNLYKERVIVFFRQKKEAHRARIIFGLLGLTCAELHGSMNQTQRISSVEDFRDGKVSYLLATDLASRGLDIKGVDTVINYEAPQSLEIYVHRVGRTARAGRKGVALTLASETDRKVVKSAVKAAKSQGAKIVSRQIDSGEVDALQAQIDEMDDEIEEIMQEEKEEKQIAHVEMQVKKGENLIQHEAEIKARPRRTWFESEHDKKQSKQAGRDELNGVWEGMKKKTGKLSNKDKKRLDIKQLRAEGGAEWRKGKSSEADMKARHKEQAKTRAKGRASKGGDKDAAPSKPKGKGKAGGKRR
jgi:ATP-dependent RNA helicase DDX27